MRRRGHYRLSTDYPNLKNKPERDVGHLQVLGSRDRVDGARSRAHVDDDGLLNHGDHEVRPLPHYRLLDTLKSVEYHRPLPAVHVEQTHLSVCVTLQIRSENESDQIFSDESGVVLRVHDGRQRGQRTVRFPLGGLMVDT